MWVNGFRTRTNSDEQVVSLEDPNLLGMRCGGVKFGRLENTMKEVTMFLRISFKEKSQQ